MPDHDLSHSDLQQLFPEVTLTVEEIATRLRRCETSVLRAIKRGDLRALAGLGRPYVVTRSAVIAWALGEDEKPSDDESSAARTANVEPDRATVNPSDAASRPAVSAEAMARRRAMPAKRRAA